MVADRVFASAPRASEPLEGRAGELIPAALPELRRERGPFDSDDDLLLAAFYSEPELDGLRQAARRAARPAVGGTPAGAAARRPAQRACRADRSAWSGPGCG